MFLLLLFLFATSSLLLMLRCYCWNGLVNRFPMFQCFTERRTGCLLIKFFSFSICFCVPCHIRCSLSFFLFFWLFSKWIMVSNICEWKWIVPMLTSSFYRVNESVHCAVTLSFDKCNEHILFQNHLICIDWFDILFFFFIFFYFIPFFSFLFLCFAAWVLTNK